MKFYGPYILNASLVFKRIHFRLDISDITRKILGSYKLQFHVDKEA